MAFIEKPPAGQAPSNLINAGTYVLEPAVLDRIPAGGRVSIEHETFPALVAEQMLYALASDAELGRRRHARHLHRGQPGRRRPRAQLHRHHGTGSTRPPGSGGRCSARARSSAPARWSRSRCCTRRPDRARRGGAAFDRRPGRPDRRRSAGGGADHAGRGRRGLPGRPPAAAPGYRRCAREDHGDRRGRLHRLDPGGPAAGRGAHGRRGRQPVDRVAGQPGRRPGRRAATR